MKLLVRGIVPVIALTIMLTGFAFGQVRSIGTINLKTVFDSYWKTKQASAGLKDRAADMEKEHKNMLDDYHKAREDYQSLLTAANDPGLNPEEKDKRKKTAEDKLKYLKDQEDVITQYERQARSTLDEQQRRMRENILGEIRTIINAKAKAANYNLVIDVSAETQVLTPIVVYTNSLESDLTENVLKELNATAPADALKPEAKDEKKEEKKDEKKEGKK